MYIICEGIQVIIETNWQHAMKNMIRQKETKKIKKS